MKIIHTSDWHLGQNFYNKSRKREHRLFLNWLCETAKEQEVDAIIVAGDIFDTGTPPSYARKLYYQFITQLNSLEIQLIVLGGNHDSISTLSESKDLLQSLNTQVIAGVMSDTKEQVIDIYGKSGELLGLVCAIPYLRPQQLIASIPGQTGADKRQSLQQSITDFYQSTFNQAQERKEQMQLNGPIIATGHLTTIGSKVSDSVRDIYIGSIEAYSSKNFPNADYIALGHLHRSQKVADHIRYSGSPIPLSFDELNCHKRILVIEFEKAKLMHVSEQVIPKFQVMKSISGTLKEIHKQIDQIKVDYKDKEVWLDVEVEESEHWHDLIEQVNKMVKNSLIEILKLTRKKNKNNIYIESEPQRTLHELTPIDVFKTRLAANEELKQKQKDKLINAFMQIIEEVEANENH